MSRPPGAAPDAPARLCPKCQQTLTFHNARTEPKAKGRSARVEVYFCIHHGFYNVTKGQPLKPGM